MKRLLYSSVSVLVFGTAAQAQGLPIPTALASAEMAAESAEQPADAATGAPSGEAAASTDTGIPDIVVTASRRAENLQRAALSIQAYSGDALTRANVVKPEDLTNLAPGVSIASGGNYPQVYIRGVGSGGTQSYAEGAVAFNIDGVVISRPWATRGLFYDLERIEILKGPQGTLYGRNASGGAINLITAKPKLGSMSGFAELSAGDYDMYGATAAVNVPLGDTVAIRAAGTVTGHDGYLSDGYMDDKTRAARLQMLFKPNDDVSVLLYGSYQHVGGMGAGPIASPQLPGKKFRGAADPAVVAIYQAQPLPAPVPSTLFFPNDDGFLDDTVYAIGAEINWNLGFGTLTVLPAYRDGKLHDRNYLPGFLASNNEHDRQTSVEARLGGESEKLKWVIGAYYFDERQTALDPGMSFTIQATQVQNFREQELTTRSYAAFGQATFSVTDAFRVTGGARYTYERKTVDGVINAYTAKNAAGACGPGFAITPTPLVNPYVCQRNVPLRLPGYEPLTYNNVTYKVGVEYDLAPRSMAYASISTGFKSGGYFGAPPPVLPADPGNTFKPEKLQAFEVGVKNRFLDNRLQLNLEAYYWRYKDHQESHTGPTSIAGFFTNVTENAGRATIYGVDLDLAFRPTPADEFRALVQYNHSKYNTFLYTYPTGVLGVPVVGCPISPPVAGTSTIDCSGEQLIRSPTWSGTVGYNHTFDLGEMGSLTAGATAQFASSQELSIEFLDSTKQDSYVVGDLDLTYTSANKRWSVSAFVHNVTNELIYSGLRRVNFIRPNNPAISNPDGLILGTARPPRTIGGRVRVNF